MTFYTIKNLDPLSVGLTLGVLYGLVGIIVGVLAMVGGGFSVDSIINR